MRRRPPRTMILTRRRPRGKLNRKGEWRMKLRFAAPSDGASLQRIYAQYIETHRSHSSVLFQARPNLPNGLKACRPSIRFLSVKTSALKSSDTRMRTGIWNAKHISRTRSCRSIWTRATPRAALAGVCTAPCLGLSDYRGLKRRTAGLPYRTPQAKSSMPRWALQSWARIITRAISAERGTTSPGMKKI